MPNRIIREGINSSPRVNALTMGAELLYRRLMTVVDDFGRYHGSVVVLRGACWPTNPDKISEKEVGKWLNELLRGDDPLVRTYNVAGAVYIEVQDFRQRTRSESKFPDPPWQTIDGQLPADCGQPADNPPQNARPRRRRSAEALCEGVVRSASAAPARPDDGGKVVEMPGAVDADVEFAAIYADHVTPGFQSDGQYEFSKLLHGSIDHAAAVKRIRSSHAEWMEFFRANPSEYRPGIGKWFREYLGKKPQSREPPSGVRPSKQQENAAAWDRA